MLRIVGNLDCRGLAELDRCCRAELAAGHRVVLDFTTMTDCPSALFLVLVQLSDPVRARHGRLQVIGLGAAVSGILGMSVGSLAGLDFVS